MKLKNIIFYGDQEAFNMIHVYQKHFYAGANRYSK